MYIENLSHLKQLIDQISDITDGNDAVFIGHEKGGTLRKISGIEIELRTDEKYVTDVVIYVDKEVLNDVD